MLKFVQTHTITMQFSVVMLLIVTSLQGVRGFKIKAFYLIALGWGANLAYLLVTETNPTFLRLTTAILPRYLGTLADFFDFLANAFFWFVAHRYGQRSSWLYFRSLNDVNFVICQVFVYIIYVALTKALPQESFAYFLLSSLPQVLFDMLALLALAQYFEELTAQIRDSQAQGLQLMYRGTLVYAVIQPLQFFAHDFIRQHLHADIAYLGFALGFMCKIAILLGVIGLFVRSAETLTSSRAEQQRVRTLTTAIDRLAHELGTPISETLNYVVALKNTTPSDLSIRIRRLEGSASRAAAILGASRFGVNFATSNVENRQPDGTWADESFKTLQVVNLNTLVEIAETAVKQTRTEKVNYHHQYSARCCLECVPNEIIQVLINILRNSCDAFPKKEGRIEIITLNEPSSEMEKARWPKGKVKIIIRDNGEGISEGIKKDIFTEGYSTRSGTGRGFGLKVVEKFVAENNGTVEINSPPQPPGLRNSKNQGTEVILTFPRVPCLPR